VRPSCHPLGELPRAVAGEDEVGMAVDEAGNHAAPARVDLLVRGRAPGALDRRHPPAGDHEGGILDHAQRTIAELGLAGDELPDVVDDHRGHRHAASIAARSSAPTSISTWAPSLTTCRSSTITDRTSAADAAKTSEASALCLPCTAVNRSEMAPAAARSSVGVRP